MSDQPNTDANALLRTAARTSPKKKPDRYVPPAEPSKSNAQANALLRRAVKSGQKKVPDEPGRTDRPGLLPDALAR